VPRYNTLQRTPPQCHTHRNTHCNTPFCMMTSGCMSKTEVWDNAFLAQICVTHCNTLQHTAAHAATRCHTHSNTHCSTLFGMMSSLCMSRQRSGAAHLWRRCVQHAAAHCNSLQHTAAHCSTLQHTAAQCNTLQHTQQHTPQHTLRHTFLQGDTGVQVKDRGLGEHILCTDIRDTL